MKNTHGFVAALLVFAALLPNAAQSAPFGNTGTYTNVVWSVSTTVPQFARCNELRVDATGDLNNSPNISVYGALNCFAENGSYPVNGNAFFSDNGTFSMNLILSNNIVLQCFNLTGLNGTCKYIRTTDNFTLGTAFITFR